MLLSSTCPQASSIARTWTATDACGNSSTCTQTITITDTTPPTITCPANATIDCDADSSPTATGSATATDNCDAAPSVTFTDATAVGLCPQESTITRTWTATDACGNFSTCEQTILLVDNAPPTITCPADVSLACADDNTPTGTGMATATDGCDGTPTVTFSDVTTTGACACDYVITRTWTATDACNNSSTCEQIITVSDPCLGCDITAFNVVGTPVVCGNTGTYELSVSWTDGPDASVVLNDANAVSIGGDTPATVANGTAIFTYNIGTNADISVTDSEAVCTFSNIAQASPAATPIDFMPVEGTCDTAPQITLPPGYTCVYAFLTGTHSGNTGTGATAMYPAALVNNDQGTVQFTITNPCGTSETLDVNFICVSCAASSGTWD